VEGGLKKNFPGFQDELSMMLLSKSLLFSSLGSQITNDFVWKSKAGNPLIHFNFCQSTSTHDLR